MTRSRIAVPLVAALACLGIGCGRVHFERADDPDAAIAGCTVHDTIASCGAACTRCASAGDRQIATCNGTSCGTACAGAAPRCSDDSCARLAWRFESGTLDGITPRDPPELVLAVREHAGNPALAIDVTDLTEVSFRVPICLSGDVALQTRTLTATVVFEGSVASGLQYYMQTSMPQPMNGAYLSAIDLEAFTPVMYSVAINLSQFAATATGVVFQAGTLGAQFSGTIWFDDIEIQ